MLTILIIVLVAGLIYLANRGRASDIEKGVQRNDPPWGEKFGAGVGPILLIGGIVAAVAFLQMDTTSHTEFGRIANPSAENRQQNFIMVSGFVAVVGAILTAMRWKR